MDIPSVVAIGIASFAFGFALCNLLYVFLFTKKKK